MASIEHHQNVRKPSGIEIYQDAARILEELLEKRLDGKLRVPLGGRQKSDPISRRLATNIKSNQAHGKAKSIPYRHSKSLDEEQDISSLLDRVIWQKTKIKLHGGSDSSIDTDVDEKAEASEEQKKKSLFKRAKERLLHSFHHDQKGRLGKPIGKSDNQTSPSKKQKIQNELGGENTNNSNPPHNTTEPPSSPPSAYNTNKRSSTLQPLSPSSQSKSPSPSSGSLNLPQTVVSCFSGSTSTSSCNTLQPDNTSPEPGTNTLSNTNINVLDSPGEDIEFIDTDSMNRNSKSAEEQSLSQSQRSAANKEALYGKIAQRLIEMGDFLSVSDHESSDAVAAQSYLEKDIIACLRTGGDRYSRQLDESVEEMTLRARQESYQRFHSTMQNSMGSELSWNHLAFLFYTTKGVVSTVGEGSKKAHQVKEFTLQYISDTFASWIMDQGGFDSVLSSGESDFDVD